MHAAPPQGDGSEAAPADAPEWFRRNMAAPRRSRRVVSDGCSIHYLLWDGPPEPEAGLLLVHGGGGHAHWWSFLAPWFAGRYRVAAPDLSGMGDSGRRAEYGAAIRAAELGAVVEDAGLGPRPFVVGHSFGGLVATRFARERGGGPDGIGGLVIADSPIRSPEERERRGPPRRSGTKRHYPDFAAGLARFRLLPEQECGNAFLVAHIARHSLARDGEGWTWKFDPGAMHQRRFSEPYHRHLAEASCPTALVYGDESALVTPETVAYMRALMAPGSPVVGIPEARHHLFLDQPVAFAAALRAVLDGWSRG